MSDGLAMSTRTIKVLRRIDDLVHDSHLADINAANRLFRTYFSLHPRLDGAKSSHRNNDFHLERVKTGKLEYRRFTHIISGGKHPLGNNSVNGAEDGFCLQPLLGLFKLMFRLLLLGLQFIQFVGRDEPIVILPAYIVRVTPSGYN
nr:hypothetical protein [Geoanaerobacter pelophilus]